MGALQAWSWATRLHIGGTASLFEPVDVLFEPAEVVLLVLPTVVPFIGVPLTPLIETLGCDVRECRWFWERLPQGSAADGWQHVGCVSDRHSNMGPAY